MDFSNCTAMKYPCIPLSWKLEETLQLLQLVEAESEWPLRVAKLKEIFGEERPLNFFTEESCKDEFERVMSSGHPEHFLRQQGERYSQKELVHAWINYLKKQYEIKKTQEGELLLIKLREKANLFNRIWADDCDLSDEEIGRLLEEAREEDSKRDSEVVSKELEFGMQKLKDLQILHETNPEKYPALKIIIPPSHPSETAAAAPFSPIKPLFEGLTPPVQLFSRATCTADVGTHSEFHSPEVDSPQKECSIPSSSFNNISSNTAIDASDNLEKSSTPCKRLRTLSAGSGVPFSTASSGSPRRLEEAESPGNLAIRSTPSKQALRSPLNSQADELRNIVSETPAKPRIRRNQKITRLTSSGITNTADNDTRTSAEHEHALHPQLISASKSDNVVKDEKDNEEEDEEKLRRSERHNARIDFAATASTAPVQTSRRKRAPKTETVDNNEVEKKPNIAKRRRLPNRDVENGLKRDRKNQIESTVEVQSSPEPDKKEKHAEEQEADYDKSFVELRTRSRASKTTVAVDADEKTREKAGVFRESPTNRSGKRNAGSMRSNRKQSKRSDPFDGDVEQKALMVTAWRMISSHRHAAIFAHPVSDRDARGYSKTVKSRMDLSTLKKQLDGGLLHGMKDFKRKVLLMFVNAVMFNSTGHDVNHYAKEMASDTLSSLKMLQKDVLFVRGTTHMTRRSAAFAAEEAKFVRSRFSASRSVPPKTEEVFKEKTSENTSRETNETSKTPRSVKTS